MALLVMDEGTMDIGRGPLLFNVQMARRQGWREREIGIAWWVLSAILGVFQWRIAWRLGYR